MKQNFDRTIRKIFPTNIIQEWEEDRRIAAAPHSLKSGQINGSGGAMTESDKSAGKSGHPYKDKRVGRHSRLTASGRTQFPAEYLCLEYPTQYKFFQTLLSESEIFPLQLVYIG